MPRARRTVVTPPPPDVDAALAAMGAEELRDVVRDTLLELDPRAHGRVVGAIVDRAARGGSGWAPAALAEADVAEAVAFAEAATRVGHADPSDVDDRLRRGTAAFLRRDYPAARRIFGALLPPVAEGAIDLGQHELVDEVLGVEASEGAAQYVVSAYMTSDPPRRAAAVRAAIDAVQGVAHFFEPLAQIERAAVEPLPGLDAFLAQWRALVEQEAAGERRSEWDTQADSWLREVVQRMEGTAGLAALARATRRAEDLRAWCRSLVEGGSWEAALGAFAEAAELITGKGWARAEFLDGAALAAQQLGRRDRSRWLERAWRAEPGMLRLRRWLGSAGSTRALRARATEALAACQAPLHRQRAFLHVLRGEVEAAAKLLAVAPGLGWSSGEHPGHLLFPVFQTLLGADAASPAASAPPEPGVDVEEIDILPPDRDQPRLASPEAGEILRLAGIAGIPEARVRRAVLAAMRTAAEKRVAGVTAEKRRRHYGHAASLVAACVACERSPEAARWAAGIREAYRGFPALRAELDRHLGAS